MASELFAPSSVAGVSQPPVARGRYWLAFGVLALFPLSALLIPLLSGGSPQANWPATVPGLLWFCALKLAIFGTYYGLAWAFTRSSRDELFLPWRGNWKTPFLAAFLSVGTRAAVLGIEAGLLFLVAAMVARFGVSPAAFTAAVKAQSGGADKIFLPLLLHGSLTYRVLMVTLISFVLAGIREELWRGAVMNSLQNLAPRLNSRRKNGLALGVSSVLFGLGHLYQGWAGVFGTSLVGLIFGAVTLRRRSVWPAVIAHGCFDATSFLLLLAGH